MCIRNSGIRYDRYLIKLENVVNMLLLKHNKDYYNELNKAKK